MEGSEPSTYKIFEVKIVQITQNLKDNSELTVKILEGSEPFDYKIFKVEIVQIAQNQKDRYEYTKKISEGFEPFSNKIFEVKFMQNDESACKLSLHYRDDLQALFLFPDIFEKQISPT